MTARSRRSHTSIVTLGLAAIALAAAIVARAPDAAAQTARRDQPGNDGFATLDDKLDWYGGRASSAARDQARFAGTSFLGLFVDVLDPGRLELQYEGAEVQALDGARLDAGALGAQVAGGLSLGFGGRALRWLRLPELVLSVGGASIDGSWQRPRGQAQGLEVRPTSLFLFRVELDVGIVVPLRRVRPYALLRIAGGYYSVDTEVRHASLGGLGADSVDAWVFEVGTEVGLAFTIGDHVELALGWRATWYGTPAQGLAFTLIGGGAR
jgi:opacity protein-like surface antigen